MNVILLRRIKEKMKERLIMMLCDMWQDRFYYKHYKPLNYMTKGLEIQDDINKTEKTLKEVYKVTDKELDEIFERQKQIFLDGIKGVTK